MNEDPDRTDRQLALMTEIRLIADRLGIELWLRGGWAMDFFLGEVTRAHRDIDFYAWANDARKLAKELGLEGYAPLAGPHPGQQLDFTKVDEDLSFALLADNPQGQVVVAGGPFDGEPGDWNAERTSAHPAWRELPGHHSRGADRDQAHDAHMGSRSSAAAQGSRGCRAYSPRARIPRATVSCGSTTLAPARGTRALC